LSETAPKLLTRFVNEKRWIPTRREEALRLIKEEMPQTDAEATLRYIESEIKLGKTVTLGTCSFKLDDN
jgi:hypothetical protein